MLERALAPTNGRPDLPNFPTHNIDRRCGRTPPPPPTRVNASDVKHDRPPPPETDCFLHGASAATLAVRRVAMTDSDDFGDFDDDVFEAAAQQHRTPARAWRPDPGPPAKRSRIESEPSRGIARNGNGVGQRWQGGPIEKFAKPTGVNGTAPGNKRPAHDDVSDDDDAFDPPGREPARPAGSSTENAVPLPGRPLSKA